MHCLEVIVRRNEEAAGREAARAVNKQKWDEARASIGDSISRAFSAGAVRGRQEG